MLVLIFGSSTDAFQAGLVTLVITVAEIESSYGHSGVDKLLELWDIPARRTHGTDNFRLTAVKIRLGQDIGKGDVGAAKLRSSWSRHDDDGDVLVSSKLLDNKK